jgi:hypothetical protein
VASTKEWIVAAVERLPDDADFWDVLDCVVFLYEIERGEEDVLQGKTISHAEAVERMRKWLSHPDSVSND